MRSKFETIRDPQFARNRNMSCSRLRPRRLPQIITTGASRSTRARRTSLIIRTDIAIPRGRAPYLGRGANRSKRGRRKKAVRVAPKGLFHAPVLVALIHHRREWTSRANGASVSHADEGRLAQSGSCPAGDVAIAGPDAFATGRDPKKISLSKTSKPSPARSRSRANGAGLKSVS
jgi:hypothetical protein